MEICLGTNLECECSDAFGVKDVLDKNARPLQNILQRSFLLIIH